MVKVRGFFRGREKPCWSVHPSGRVFFNPVPIHLLLARRRRQVHGTARPPPLLVLPAFPCHPRLPSRNRRGRLMPDPHTSPARHAPTPLPDAPIPSIPLVAALCEQLGCNIRTFSC
ncbi:hypothetical protein PVAP13_5NG227724 [Panicum virgatum]|uniref:Uncharacterized protein n=1 Tax=Panicum virgatum TaxID=38727 RepID=A0A8T0RQL6_PANVG|nr:hypothetical protein PVAP13_5NG227724 [Panicum virgatum]